MTRTLGRLGSLLSIALVVPALAACDFEGAYDLPLPGNPVDADDAFTVTASFADVLNVVPRSPVMVDDVVVGQVSEVEREGWAAEVTLQVRKDVTVSDDVTAEIRQTSLLGEKYVALVEPRRRRVGRLEEGDHIPLASTGRNPEVEEVLGALSFLLSGGGVGQIRTISTELNKVMSGRTGRIQHLMRGLDDLVGTLDEQKHDIIDAMESINSLADTLVREKKTIQDALDATGPALEVLNRQHRQLMTMLGQLDELGRVGTRVIGATKEDMLATLRHLQPILQRLNETGESLPRGLSLLLSFPFPQEAADTVLGDYANASFALEIDLTKFAPVPGGDGGDGPLPGLPGVPDLPGPLGGGGDGPLTGLPGVPLRGSVGTGGGLLEEGLG
jgi:phospholipid/cholesterol/gamma-HCH transport system substrate-binding protein